MKWWKVGKHNIICGDSFSPEIQEILKGMSFDLIFTDPPFEIDGAAIAKLIKPLSNQFVVAGQGKNYIKLCSELNFCFEHVGIRNQPRGNANWNKPHVLHWNTAFLSNGGKHCFDRELAQSGYFPSAKPYKVPPLDYAKPLEWAVDMLSVCNALTMCDPFFGTGTALIAADKLGKIFTGVEIEEQKCLLAIARLLR